jgi:transposase-like protein
MPVDRIEFITSVERRRGRGVAQMARLVAAMNEPGAVVTEIARNAGVEASLLYGGLGNLRGSAKRRRSRPCG